MAVSLLTTKLAVPPSGPHLLSRSRLIRRLENGLQLGRRLTLVSAPAGYGKTTLLSEWASGDPVLSSVQGSARERLVAWLSLDAGDNDLRRFLRYAIAALQAVCPELGEAAQAMLASPPAPGAAPSPPVEPLLTSLINDLATLDQSCVLVLDDYHLIQHPKVHEALMFLLDHLPSNAHLVLATRADPPLPLARLRGRGQLTELRQADLRFTSEEAAAFLKRAVGLDLTPQEVAALEERTEGWITGLQLAALSMRGRDDVSGFLSAFTGSHRYVLDYLTEEVLQRQPEGLRAFLLQTSFLDRLSGPLCDAVLGISEETGQQGFGASDESGADPSTMLRTDSLIRSIADSLDRSIASSQAVLEHLEATNLFVVPLDEQRAWYRYHRLFADLLRARLGELYPDRVALLHRRASAWYEQERLLDEALSHALAAGDSARAAEIVARHGRSLLLRGELTTLLRWIEALPEEDVRSRAPICVTHAWALLLTGQLEAVEPRLTCVGRLVPADSPLLGDVSAIRAYVASQRGELARTIELAERALERLPEAKLGERAVVYFVLGGAQLWRGNVPAAADAFGKAAAVGQEGGNLHLVQPALNSLTTIQISQGELRRAEVTAAQAVTLVAGPDGQPLPIGAGAVSALAELACERDRLDEALRYARQGVELARLWGNADTLAFGYLTLADVLLTVGRLDEARDALHDAERLSQDLTLFPSFPPALRTARARLWLREGDLAAAGRWAEGVTIPKLDVTAMERALTLARVQWARRRLDDALDIVGRLLEAAREQGLKGWLIQGLALEAVIHQAQGHETLALGALAEALGLAQPEGYLRSFVDLGPPMAALLQRAAAQDIASEYVGRLLAAFDLAVEAEMLRSPQAKVLIEPLSPRELEVLGLVAEGLSNRQVGQRLHIAESTVKSHLNNVYGKLGVDNRTQAAAKARALNLL